MSTTAPDLNPYHDQATLSAGVLTYIDETGEIQVIPNTTTSPYGEPPLNTETDLTDAVYGDPIAPVDPPLALAAEEAFLHEQLHGAPWHGHHGDHNVNPANPGIPNLGPVGEQDFQSGHSQIIVHNPSAEQGWGLDPAILRPRYPQAQGVNPFYRMGQHRRMGDLETVPNDIPFGDITQLNVELQWQNRRRVSTVHRRLLANPQAVSYSDTVPVGGQAGPLNLIPEGEEAIY